MTKSSHILFGLLLPVSSLVACATSPGDDPDDSAELDTAKQSGPSTPTPTPAPAPAPAEVAGLLAQIAFSAPSYNGSGCPQGTGTVALSADRRTLSVTAPAAFTASTAGTIVERRKICQAMLAFTAPAGIRFGIASVKLTASAVVSGTGAGRVTLEKRFPFGADDLTNVNVTRSSALATETNAGVTWSECGGSSIAITSAQLVASGVSAELKGSSFTATLVAERCP